MLKVKCSLEKAGFDASEETAQDYYDGYRASSFGKGTRWHHYIGWLNGEAVAMASLLLYAVWLAFTVLLPCQRPGDKA